MAPIKFEEHIKDQLEERRIQPSAAGWERISGQLEIHQGKKKSKRVLWMSIAASFVIGVAIAALFFQGAGNTTVPIVAVPDSEDSQEIREENNKQEVLFLKEEAFNTQVAEIEEVVTKESPKPREEKANKQPIFKSKLKQAVAAVNIPKAKTAETVGEGIQAKEKYKKHGNLGVAITQKVDEVIAQVEEQVGITDQEIDNLLLEAQREIMSKQLMRPRATTVDANALLLDVEAEIDPERFRDRIFKTLKTEFGKAIEAVANKDN